MTAGRSEHPDDLLTISTAETDGAQLDGHPMVAALTILFHPDVGRIGDTAVLDGVTQLSRQQPIFIGPGGRRAPLEDPVLSRRPAILEPLHGGGFATTPGGSELDIDGRRLHQRAQVTAEELARGVVLVLRCRIVLFLHLVRREREPGPDLGLVGESDAMADVRRAVQRVAILPVPVLIRGESGVGKELIARAIHDQSPRRAMPLICVNMGAVSPATAVSELFGHVKGAFTGANTDHDGYFAQAHGGTLFLDEIGETPTDVQAILLRTLETGEIRPLGGKHTRQVDVRVLSATDMDLERAVDDGRFRLALRHRLAGLEVEVPPLRDRRADIARLFMHFLRRELVQLGESQRLATPTPGGAPWLPPRVMVELVRYHWPGNVRQLRNTARQIALDNHDSSTFRLPETVHAMLRGSGARAPDQAIAPAPSVPSAPSPDAAAASRGQRGKALEIPEERLIAALRANRWRPGETARALGIARASLYKLMNQSQRIRKARDISRDEILATMAACGGDLDAMVQRLEVSKRGLKLRMTELGLDS